MKQKLEKESETKNNLPFLKHYQAFYLQERYLVRHDRKKYDLVSLKRLTEYIK